MANISKKFKFRNFISMTLSLLFVIVIFSAVVLYIRPEGSIARWTGWTFMGFSKEIWEGIHTIFSLLFVIFALMHFSLNVRVFIHYFKRIPNGRLKRMNEFVAALILVCIFQIISVMQLQPVWKIRQWRSSIKKGNHIIRANPPESDFDKEKLTEIAKGLDVPVEELVKNMTQYNLVVEDTNNTLLNIALKNKVSPEDIYIRLINKP